METTKTQPSVRDRLLDAADALFYREGIHSVGIDRVLAHAGVAKASLYGTFGSKEELVRAYLERRALARRAEILERIAQHPGPREQILGVFDLLAETAAGANFHGCAFINACLQGPKEPGAARDVSTDQRNWKRDLFTRLAAELGASRPEQVGRRLSLLNDAALVAAWMDSDPSIVEEAKGMAELLLDAQTSGKRVTGAREPREQPSRGRRARAS